MRLLITGGGTAGHLNPGLALAQHLTKIDPSSEVLFAGTRGRIESEAVPKAGFKIRFLSASGFQRKLNLGLVQTVTINLLGIFQASKLLSEFRPDVIFATGGYVCVPVLTIAKIKKIPYVLHEQNAIPGLTVKLFGKSAAAICVSLKGSEGNFPRGKAILTGNPLRDQFTQAIESGPAKKSGARSGKDKAPSAPDKINILIFGGSLGARHLNETVLSFIEDLQSGELQSPSKLCITHSSGMRDHSMIAGYAESRIDIKKLNSLGVEYTIVPYIDDMHSAMSAADILIARAGATTLAELIHLQLPSILVPYPKATDNHQMKNARLLEREGAAIVIDDGDLNAHILHTELLSITEHPEHLQNMKNDLGKLAQVDAVEKIFEVIEKVRSSKNV